MVKHFVFLLLAANFSNLVAQDVEKAKRARPPEWKKNERRIFFRNAFREGITGKPPPLNRSLRQTSKIPAKQVDGAKWSRFISSQTIEDEIKSTKILVDQIVTTERRFRSGNFKLARQRFSELAILFGIVAHYDGEIRWKDQATVARDLFAKSARNAIVGTTSVYRDAVARKNDMQDLVSGASLTSTEATDWNHNWSQIAERKPLMQRLKVSHGERISQWLSSKAEFRKHASRLKKEAEILAAFSVVLTKDEMEDAGDEEYKQYSDAMRDAALQIIKSVQDEAYEQASKANGVISNSCAGCHDMYRG